MWYQYYFTGLHRTPVLYTVISLDSGMSTLVFQWIPVLEFSAMTWENTFIVVSLCHSECDQSPLVYYECPSAQVHFLLPATSTILAFALLALLTRLNNPKPINVLYILQQFSCDMVKNYWLMAQLSACVIYCVFFYVFSIHVIDIYCI